MFIALLAAVHGSSTSAVGIAIKRILVILWQIQFRFGVFYSGKKRCHYHLTEKIVGFFEQFENGKILLFKYQIANAKISSKESYLFI